MDPVVRLGLTQPKVQAVHGLQGVGLLIDEDKKQFVFHLGQAAFGAAATPVTGVPIICQMAVAPAPHAVCHNFCSTKYYGWHANEPPECTRAPHASPGRCVPPALGLHPELL